jgi:hypothetical protein
MVDLIATSEHREESANYWRISAVIIHGSEAQGDAVAVDLEDILEDSSMTKKLPKRGLPPINPGKLLREEILPALGRPKTEIARPLGASNAL